MSENFGPNTVETEWLSLLRYQLSVAIEQSHAQPPLNALAINTLQDAVEGLLSLAAEHINVETKKNSDFIQLFDAVAAKLQDSPNLASFRGSMLSLNTARVGFKHHGNTPSEATLRRHVDRGREFMEQLTVAAFTQELDAVSLLVFVRSTQVRAHLERSLREWKAHETLAAMTSLRLAFDSLVQDFEERKVWTPGTSMFTTKKFNSSSSMDAHKAGRTVEDMWRWLEEIDKWLKYVSLGVDMRKYAYFEAHTPTVTYGYMNAEPQSFVHEREGISVNEQIYERCFKFVTDTALAFAIDDFDFDAWTARHHARRVTEKNTD
jgi:hypothetical protein